METMITCKQVINKAKYALNKAKKIAYDILFGKQYIIDMLVYEHKQINKSRYINAYAYNRLQEIEKQLDLLGALHHLK